MSYLEDIPPELWIYGSIADYLDPKSIANLMLIYPKLEYISECIRDDDDNGGDAIEILIQNRHLHKWYRFIDIDIASISKEESDEKAVVLYRFFIKHLLNKGVYWDKKEFQVSGPLNALRVKLITFGVAVEHNGDMIPLNNPEFLVIQRPNLEPGVEEISIVNDPDYLLCENPYDVSHENFLEEYDRKLSEIIKKESEKEMREKIAWIDNIEYDTQGKMVLPVGEPTYFGISDFASSLGGSGGLSGFTYLDQI